MSLTQEQLNIVKNIETFEELKQKAKDNHFEVNDSLLLDLYNSYHTESELSDEELDNVTGGCGDKEVNLNDPACEHYENEYGWEYPSNDVKKCRYCKYCYYKIDGTVINYCSYDD